MNEAAPCHAVPDGMHHNDPAPSAQAGLLADRRIGRSGAQAVAGSVAALMLSGCPIEGGGGVPVSVVGGAASARQIEAHNQILAAQRNETAIALAAQNQRRIEVSQARANVNLAAAQLEQQRQISDQIAADQARQRRLALAQEQERQRQNLERQRQEQGNNGRDHIPPGQIGR